MYEPRCPECDIELDCTSEKWCCPLCGETPKPGQYVWSPAHVPDTTQLRDVATEAAAMLIEIVSDKPELRDMLLPAYNLAIDIAERADMKGQGHETQQT